MALDAAADEGETGRYPFALDLDASPWQLDWRPIVAAAVADLQAGAPAGSISARFHRALAAAAAELVRAAAARRGRFPVVLTGGVFQNARLAAQVGAELSPGFAVYLHGQVPPGDGGIALGQAAVAAAATG